MRKLAFLIIVIFSFSISAKAQSKGDIRVIGGLTYGTDIEDIGVNFGGEFLFTDRIAADATYSYYFVGSNFTYTVFNIDGRYYIPNGSDFQWYALLGIAFNTSKADIPPFFTNVRIRDNGLNLGGGFVFPISSSLGFHAQAKINTAFSSQLELQAGLSFELN